MVRPEPLPGLPYPHGLSVEMAEAFAEYLHKRIRGELGFTVEEARDPEAMLAQGYRGSRYSFGYPACSNLADQKQLLALLNAEEIGITLSEEDRLDPRAIDLGHRRPPPPGQILCCLIRF
jgi:5-methyltetrahydrofolate--homocysteine methyltransferase